MMKRVYAFWLAAGIAIAFSMSLAAEFSPELEFELSQAKAGGFVSAIVILESPIDIRTLDSRLHEEKADLARRNREVLEALKYNASSTQPQFETELQAAQLNGSVKAFTAYWIENLFVVYGSKPWFESLRPRGDIKYVTENFQAELIEPIIDEQGDRSPRNPLDAETTTPGQNAIQTTRVNRELAITGQGVLVANLDTGVDGNHPALASRWRGNFAPAAQCWRDALGSAPTFPSDLNSHGTHVMGTIAGRAFVGLDTITVGGAPNALWIADNAINQGVGGAFDNDVIDAFQWFANPDGNIATVDDVPDVIQNSWGVFTGLGYVQCFDLWNSVVLNCEAAGPVITWSAGNESTSGLRSPAIYSINAYQIFSVGAVDATNFAPPYPLASFSSRGPTPCAPSVPDNFKPEISAPGVNVYSSVPGGGYSSAFSGTSMAGPHVAGVVALMREACPNCDHITIKDAIMNTATDLGAAGEDNLFGHGLINAYDAVLAVGNLARIGGVVTNGNTSSPISGVTVRALGTTQSAVTNFNGEYMLLTSAGTYSIEFSLFGYATDTVFSVVAVQGDTLILNNSLQPSPAGNVSGFVTNCGGGPAVGAAVNAVGVPVPSVSTDALGHYSLNLPQGVYTFVASGVSCSPDTNINVFVGPATSLDFTLLPEPRFLCSPPDAAGYIACENGDLDGPTQDWFEIAPIAGGPGTLTGLTLDNSFVQVSLPITFSFYGTEFNSLWISSNGLITFGSGVASAANSALPNSLLGAAIAPYWDDLNPALGGQICHYYNAAEHAMIFEWYHVPHFGLPATIETFQVWLYDAYTNPAANGSSQIRIQYLDLTNLNSATSGIQNYPTTNSYGFNGVWAASSQGLADGRVITYGGSTAPLFGTLEGIIKDSLTLLPIQGALVSRVGSTQHKITDASGFFALDVVPGSYDFLITHPDYAGTLQTGVTVSAGSVTSIQPSLISKPIISGTVRDIQTNIPLGQTDVQWIDGGLTTVTDDSGRYTLIADSGIQTLAFARADYINSNVVTGSLEYGSMYIVDAGMLTLPRVTGIVSDSTTGQPVPFADVFWLEGGSLTSTDDSGRYEIVTTSGIQTLSFSRFDYAEQTVPTDPLQGGQSVQMDITLVPFPRIVGTIVDSTTHRPLRNVEVHWIEGDAFAYSDQTGFYEMVVSEGSQTLTFAKSNYGFKEFTSTPLMHGQRLTQDISLASLPFVLFLDEHFDQGAPGWSHIGAPNWEDDWHISTERSQSAPSSYKCGDVATGGYNNNNDARLISPVIGDLLPGAMLQFSMQIETRTSNSAPDSAFDGGVIEVSADGGPFEWVEPVQGYNKIFPYEDRAGDPYTGPLPGVACFGGLITTWTTYDVDLSSYAGQSVQIAFRFCSNDNSTREGWYVDDVTVQTNAPTPSAPLDLSIQFNAETNEMEFRWQDTGGPVYELYSSTSPVGPFTTFEGSTLDTFLSIQVPSNPLKFFAVIASNDFSILSREMNIR